MRSFLLLFLVLFSFHFCAHASPGDLDSSLAVRKNKLLPVPIINRTPETSLLFGVSALYTYYTSKTDTITRPSFIFATGIYTLKDQWITALYLNSWSKENKYHYLLNAGYIKYNFLYYGNGSHTLLKDEQTIFQEKTDISLNIEKKITPLLYAGIELGYLYNKFPHNAETAIFNKTTEGFNGGAIPRFGLSIAYDSRNINTYTSKGSFYKLTISQSINFLSSDYNVSRYIFESRNFVTFKKIHTFGFNTNIESVQGDVPFFELRQMGSPFIMRGYYTGRYRDQNFAAGQVEYRIRFYAPGVVPSQTLPKILSRFGLVFFGGSGTVFNNKNFAFNDFKPNYGLGLRYFYDKPSGINIRFDYGMGEKPAGEPRIGDFYFYIGEAF